MTGTGSPEAPRTREQVAALYAAHGHLVLRRAPQLLNDEAEAQDVLQEIFVSLIGEPQQLSGATSMTTFLYRVSTNQCLNRLRDGKNRGDFSSTRATCAKGRRASASTSEIACSEAGGRTSVFYPREEQTARQAGGQRVPLPYSMQLDATPGVGTLIAVFCDPPIAVEPLRAAAERQGPRAVWPRDCHADSLAYETKGP